MDFITKLFDIDFAAWVPKLPVFLGLVRTLMAFALLAGPVTMVILAALYLFKPAPEANYNFGYRTYYGMGSVEAWQFSQKIAGLAFGGVGAALTVIMLIVIFCFIGKTLMQVAIMATVCLVIQIILLLAARITIATLCKKHFDKDGMRRNPAPRYQSQRRR